MNRIQQSQDTKSKKTTKAPPGKQQKQDPKLNCENKIGEKPKTKHPQVMTEPLPQGQIPNAHKESKNEKQHKQGGRRKPRKEGQNKAPEQHPPIRVTRRLSRAGTEFSPETVTQRSWRHGDGRVVED
ncbi:hypothetical protein AMECASPLE_029009 [Ameca splendens]|uniref:Uncharacterized protein n=1 Tax=Ameca splendens TaxID=208324 RepID=A0ABV0XIM9_9TELE